MVNGASAQDMSISMSSALPPRNVSLQIVSWRIEPGLAPEGRCDPATCTALS